LLFLGSGSSVIAVADPPAIRDVLAEVGPRLRRLRVRRGVTLTALAAETGISKSTLSRLETGQRKPSLELLLLLAEAHQVPLDELVGGPEVGDPRVRFKPQRRNGRLVFPLTLQSSSLLSGQMRLILGEHDITMGPGEVAEFDTRLSHWFGPATDRRRAAGPKQSDSGRVSRRGPHLARCGRGSG
jgi:transcriptional regulator with XRE-family HTH domain